MAIKLASGSGTREAEFGRIVWRNKKHTDLITPNIRQYSKETGETFVSPPGEKKHPEITGVIKKVSVGQAFSFNDTDTAKRTGVPATEKNQWRVYITLEDSPSEPLTIIGMDVLEHKLKTVTYESLNLVGILAKHAEMVQSGELSGDTPVAISLYRKVDRKDKNKSYPAVAVRLPSGYDAEGNALFEDFKKTIHADAFPPNREPVMHNGEHLMVNGHKAYKHDAAIAWLEEKLGYLMSVYGKDELGEQADNQPGVEDEAADLAGVAEAVAGEAPVRERMAG